MNALLFSFIIFDLFPLPHMCFHLFLLLSQGFLYSFTFSLSPSTFISLPSLLALPLFHFGIAYPLYSLSYFCLACHSFSLVSLSLFIRHHHLACLFFSQLLLVFTFFLHFLRFSFHLLYLIFLSLSSLFYLVLFLLIFFSRVSYLLFLFFAISSELFLCFCFRLKIFNNFLSFSVSVSFRFFLFFSAHFALLLHFRYSLVIISLAFLASSYLISYCLFPVFTI